MSLITVLGLKHINNVYLFVYYEGTLLNKITFQPSLQIKKGTPYLQIRPSVRLTVISYQQLNLLSDFHEILYRQSSQRLVN
jgi:hypothetical protein